MAIQLMKNVCMYVGCLAKQRVGDCEGGSDVHRVLRNRVDSLRTHSSGRTVQRTREHSAKVS